jgi:mannose-1-phosphate guanylyltransferase
MAQSEGNLWAIVLAGGEGVRLRALVRGLYGEERPKQYAALAGSRSLLRQTLERAALLVPPRRTVVVTLASHAGYLAAELPGLAEVTVLAQPCDRGTAAAVLLAAHWIHARDPHATVAVFPSDHVIVDEAVFMRDAADVAAYVRESPERLVLFAAAPTAADPSYGWIERGERVGWAGLSPVHRIRDFRENPTAEVARRLYTLGYLWNTFIFVAGLPGLIDAGRECIPLLHDRLMRLDVFAGTHYESWALRQAYLFAPAADFSRAVLESSSISLGVAQIASAAWFSLGTPERVARLPARMATLRPSA